MRFLTAFAYLAFAAIAGSAVAKTHLIDFDVAPDGSPIVVTGVFAHTTRLSDLYAASGVAFSGDGELDGGAILHVSGNFGVNTISGQNFLAFNSGFDAAMSDGGFPRGPETISFDFPVSYAAIFGGSGSAVAFRLDAYDSLNQLIDSDMRTSLAGQYVRLAVEGNDIRTLKLDQDFTQTQAVAWVFDDLTFVPEPSSSALFLLGAVGLGVHYRSRQSTTERRDDRWAP